jgi:hypothetical protein
MCWGSSTMDAVTYLVMIKESLHSPLNSGNVSPDKGIAPFCSSVSVDSFLLYLEFYYAHLAQVRDRLRL